jgi:hypothetical protein
MSELTYEGLGPISREEVEAAVASGSARDVGRAALRYALNGDDWIFAERVALSLLGHADVWVRRNAATSLGHIARIHGKLHADAAIPALLRALGDPEVAGFADDALDDCETFLGLSRREFEAAA